MAALLPMRATRATFCLVIVIVFGSMLVSHADAQSSDDCVNWLDAISEYEQFSWVGTSPGLNPLPREFPAFTPGLFELVGESGGPGFSFPIPSDGYTILLPTKDAVEAYNEYANYDGVDLTLEAISFVLLSYGILVENKFAPQFGLGGNKSRLERTAFMDLPLKIEKPEGGGRVAVSGNGTGTITKPVDANGKQKLPQNACVPVNTGSEVVNVPVNIYAVDQALLPFGVNKNCDYNILKCVERFYKKGYLNINKPPYMYGKKVEWAA